MTFGINAPNGLVPVNTGNGAAWNQQANWYPIGTTASQSLFKGDAVTLSTAGTVIRATASTASLGVLDQVSFQVTTSPEKFTWSFYPGGTGGVANLVSGSQPMAYVIDDPNAVFTVQETATTQAAGSASGTPLTQAAVGNNCDLLYIAGSTLTGISSVSLNNAASSTGLLSNMKIVGLDQRVTLGVTGDVGTPGGTLTAGTAFQNWLVQFNNHIYKAGSTRP